MDQEKVGNIIKKIRKDNNLTQEEFANLFGVTYQAVSKWENGKNVPDVAIMTEISKKFNISLDELLTGEKKDNAKSLNRKWILIIALIVFVFIASICIHFYHHDDFEFKLISTTCDSFTIEGSMAYNKKKTNTYINIHKVSYCGKENNEVYDKVICKLYESSDNITSLITACEEKDLITIKDYLENVSINVNNYSSVCHKYDDSSLYLEVEAYKDEQITTYKIPISIEDNC